MDYRLLNNIVLFKNLPDTVLHQIALRMTVVDYDEDTVIIREGEPGDNFYVVLSGGIQVIKALGTPDERLLVSRGMGEFVGELSLVNPDGLRTASVRTRGPSQLWRMNHHDFEALLYEQKDLALEMIRALSERLTYAHNLTIQDLHEKNHELQEAYDDLKAAHEQIVEKERLEKELQVAHEIQQSLLPPELPNLPGYDFGALMYSARAVGGDFYDLIPLDEDRVGIVIGDVADKGVPSAIVMAQTRALIYAEAAHDNTPAEVLQQVNSHLMEMGTPKMFVTVLYGVLDRRTRQFCYARAGHELPLRLFPGQSAEILPSSKGQPLSIFETPTFDEQTLVIEPGMLLLFYTDGLLDCRNPAGEPFGLSRVKNLLPTLSALPAQNICEYLRDHLRQYQQQAPQDDDVTVMVLRAEMFTHPPQSPTTAPG
jgi:serine phosphatase RsbU (regulator of sigma subunit)